MLKLVPRNWPGNRSESRPPAHRNPAFWNRQPPSRFRARPRTDSSAIPAKRKSGEGTEGARVTGEDSAFRYDLERSDKITVSKLLIPAIPAIADPTGKSGIPVAQRANSAPESDRFLRKPAPDSGTGIVPESSNSGSRNRGLGTVDSVNSASGIPDAGISNSETATGLPDLAIPPAQNASASPAESVGFRPIPASNSGNGIAAESVNSSFRNSRTGAVDSGNSASGIPVSGASLSSRTTSVSVLCELCASVVQ